MTTPEDFEADIGWALFAAVRRYRGATDELLADLPGGPRGYWVLMGSRQLGPKSQLALAQHLGIDRTVMTYLVDDLEAGGLVKRTPDPADRRVRRVELTAQGSAAWSDARRRLQGAEDTLLARFDTEQRETLRTLLHQLATDELDESVAEAEPTRVTSHRRRKEDRGQ
ncbi:winged helix DNA-binding protein [Nocardia sp. NEAU-G5]|uniref:Winged helix DNA-binding protein n=1 Tax=Nocardia albiluteola TaxID=2842303 RepID=A0ABS6BCX2_9NOCA|nr:MarR family transcriptional regulator [Nocardia albiluteola]MBU3067316.1 winged helix DNA-binding protein [Nocardia albiluteola]